jgi:hypothetical protein
MWKCAKCAKENKEDRDDCWNCSFSRDADVNALFPISSELTAAKHDELKKTKDIWELKSDKELIFASENFAKYQVEVEEVIREELRKRGIFEPKPTQRTVGGESNLVKTSRQAETLSNRYSDAYLVAKVMIGIGETIKMLGIVLAAIILLGIVGFMSLIGNASGSIFITALLIGGIYAVSIGCIFYVIGIIVSAQGQVLTATLDSTVGSSPFLTDNLKAKIMSIPEA